VPKYCYFCESCKSAYETVHSMTEVKENCELCDARAIRRIPQIPAYIQKQNAERQKKVGDVVEDYIEQNKRSVREEKDRLKNKIYKGKEQ